MKGYKEGLMLKRQIAKLSNWQTASTNRRIFSAMLVVVVMTVAVKFAAVVKELMVAEHFGTGAMVDAFLFAYLLPAFAINVLSGSFSAAMMPTYIRTMDNKGKDAADKLFTSLMLIGVLFLIISTLVLAVFAPALLSLLGAGFNEQTIVLTHDLFYWLLPIIVLTGCGHLFSSIINAGERFAIVALTPAITPIFTIIALTFFAEQWGIFALVAGAVIGAGIELLILIGVAARRGIPVLPRWNGMTEELRSVIGQYTPMIAGAFLMSSTALVDQSMAAMLESGSVATLNYANKVVAMILGIGSMALGTSVLPHFSRLVGSEDWAGLRHTFKTYTRLIIFTTVPITALLIHFSEPIADQIYLHLIRCIHPECLSEGPYYHLSTLNNLNFHLRKRFQSFSPARNNRVGYWIK